MPTQPESAAVRPQSAQSSLDHATVQVPAGPHLNALKHGRRSATVLLPGDDPAEFQRLRADWFALFRPCTRMEARCVEVMVEHEWSLERARELRYGYHGKLRALARGGAGAESVHCERDPHRWQHSVLDCVLEEGRLERLQERERRKLAELQKLRRQNLLARLRDADAAFPQAAEPPQPLEPEPVDADGDVASAFAADVAPDVAPAASPSDDTASGENPERTAGVVNASNEQPVTTASAPHYPLPSVAARRERFPQRTPPGSAGRVHPIHPR